MPEALKSQHLFTISIKVDPPVMLGATPFGDRRIVRVRGGTFEGPRIKGTVQEGGGDWILGRNDGILQLDVRLNLETDDGHVIYMTYRGLRHGPKEVLERLGRGEAVDPSEYYFRVAPFFETGSDKYAWINGVVAVGVGDRRADGPGYVVHEIL